MQFYIIFNIYRYMKNWEKNMHIFMMYINILPTFCRIKIKTVDSITAQNTHF